MTGSRWLSTVLWQTHFLINCLVFTIQEALGHLLVKPVRQVTI